MDFSGVLQSVLAITTVIGVALAGLQRGVVQNLREANKDLRDRDADRDKKEAELEAKTTRLEADLEALGRVVTNEVQIVVLGERLEAFGERLDDHHGEAKTYWRASTDQGQQIIDALNRLSERLSGGTGG